MARGGIDGATADGAARASTSALVTTAGTAAATGVVTGEAGMTAGVVIATGTADDTETATGTGVGVRTSSGGSHVERACKSIVIGPVFMAAIRNETVRPEPLRSVAEDGA